MVPSGCLFVSMEVMFYSDIENEGEPIKGITRVDGLYAISSHIE